MNRAVLAGVIGCGLALAGVSPAPGADWRHYHAKGDSFAMISVKKTGRKVVGYSYQNFSEWSLLRCSAGRGGRAVVRKYGSNAYSWGYDAWFGRSIFYVRKGKLVRYKRVTSLKRIRLNKQERRNHRTVVRLCRNADGAFGNWKL